MGIRLDLGNLALTGQPKGFSLARLEEMIFTPATPNAGKQSAVEFEILPHTRLGVVISILR